MVSVVRRFVSIPATYQSGAPDDEFGCPLRIRWANARPPTLPGGGTEAPAGALCERLSTLRAGAVTDLERGEGSRVFDDAGEVGDDLLFERGSVGERGDIR